MRPSVVIQALRPSAPVNATTDEVWPVVVETMLPFQTPGVVAADVAGGAAGPAPDAVLESPPPPPPQAVNAYAAANAAGTIFWNFMIDLRATELRVRSTHRASGNERDGTRLQCGGRRRSNSGQSNSGIARTRLTPSAGVGLAMTGRKESSAGV
jgi:hypothetical protein